MAEKYLNKRITQTGAGTSEWIVLGDRASGYGAEVVGVFVDVTGTVSSDIEVTLAVDLENPSDSIAAGLVDTATGLTGITAKTKGRIEGPIKGIRINQASGAGTTGLTVLVR